MGWGGWFGLVGWLWEGDDDGDGDGCGTIIRSAVVDG